MVSKTLISRCCAMLVLLWFVLWVGSSHAQAAPAAETGIQAIRAAAERQVAAQLSPGVQVQAAELDSRVRMPACATELDARMQSANGSSRTVEVSCSGPQRWRLFVPVRVVDLQPRLVLTRSLRAGEALGEADLRVEQRDAAQAGPGPSDPATVAGMHLRRPLSAGQVLTADMLGTAQTIKRGQMVTLVGSVGGLEVRASGKALAGAAPGENLPVQNLSSGRVVHGTLRSDGSVAVPL